MSRDNELQGWTVGWRALAWAGGAAAGVTLLLVAGVGLVWLLGRSPLEAPAVGALPPSTPTPRALSFLRETPTPAATETQPPATAVIAVADEGESAAADVSATPSLLAIFTGDGASAANEDVIFAAPGDAEFSSLAAGSWTASADALQNEGSNAVAEQWLTLATVPESAFAVEAEIRVNGLLETVCDQSFGLTGGNPATGQAYGGGLLFPCNGDAARARLTDVSVWEDGYNADPVVAENAFDPGDDWRTYRFEVRGDRLRFLVDGVRIVSGSPAIAFEPAGGAQAGLWAQGVDLDVRSVTVHPLPSR